MNAAAHPAEDLDTLELAASLPETCVRASGLFGENRVPTSTPASPYRHQASTTSRSETAEGRSTDVWGVTRSETGTRLSVFGYTGREFGEAGDWFYRARTYQPSVGRFGAEDPLRSELLYAYTTNDPVRFSDPDGRRALRSDDRMRLGILGALRNGAGVTPEVSAAVARSIAEITAAIDRVPPSERDPVALQAIFFAIDAIGDTRFGRKNRFDNGLTRPIDGGWKCNAFVATSYGVGAGVGFGPNGYPTIASLKGLVDGMNNVPYANSLADPSQEFHNLSVVVRPNLGSIIAVTSSAGLGHTALYAGGGLVIYAGEDAVKVNTLGRMLEGLIHDNVTFRNYTGPGGR